MKSKYLLPRYFRTIGWILAIPGLILGYFQLQQHFVFTFLDYGSNQNRFVFSLGNFTDEIALSIIIVGLVFVAFSRRKIEDELIARLRMDALYWSILVNSAAFLLISLFFDSDIFIYNLCTPLLTFIIRFNYLLHLRKETFIISRLHFLPFKPWRIIAVVLSLTSVVLILINIATDYRLLTEAWLTVVDYLLFGGLWLWAFTRNSYEDELTLQYRYDSMFLAVWINYALLLVAIVGIYGFDFLAVMIVGMVSILGLFVILFNYYSICNRVSSAKQEMGGLLT